MGHVTYTDVIKFSLNTGMAALGLKLGGTETAYARQFGLRQQDRYGCAREEEGILYNPKDMVPSDVATMGIGQGIAVTPLQMIRAISAIANGGKLVRPYIVAKVTDPDGNVVKETGTQVDRQVITPEVAEEMRTMMEKGGFRGRWQDGPDQGATRLRARPAPLKSSPPRAGISPGCISPRSWALCPAMRRNTP